MTTSEQDIVALEAVVEQLRGIDALFVDLDVGVCSLHLDACIAALESRLRRARSGEAPIRRVVRETSGPF
ncbi:hypothetical protein ACFOMD_15445 [Sphingoaurantiacus capsulatus]|uniref:Uncharacterized protein n=1 Tax=Sphingoaurantiacus capsulatus TaxID=1771310 RepID=A0ABV7XCS7_9SPHN